MAIRTAFVLSKSYFDETAEVAAAELHRIPQTIRGAEWRRVVAHILEIKWVVQAGNEIIAMRRDESRAAGIARVSELMYMGNLVTAVLDFDVLDPVAVAKLVGYGPKGSRPQIASHQIMKHFDW